MIKKLKLKDEIEEMRQMLNSKVAIEEGSLIYHKEILFISQQLDKLILQYINEEKDKW